MILDISNSFWFFSPYFPSFLEVFQMCAFYNFCEIFLSSCRLLTERRFQFCRQLPGIYSILEIPFSSPRLTPSRASQRKPCKYNILIPFLRFSFHLLLSLPPGAEYSHLPRVSMEELQLCFLSPFPPRPFHMSSLSFAKFPYHFIKLICKPRSVPLVISKSLANNRSCLDLPLDCT